MKNIILASSSPRRKEILEMIGIPFQICPADIDETLLSEETSEQAVLRLSGMKAEALSGKFPGSIVIGSDTLVQAQLDCRTHTVFGKPVDEKDAHRMLKILSGQRSVVYTGICLLDMDSGQRECGYATTEVYMKSLSDAAIEKYICTKEPLDKAGAYAIQGAGAVFIEKIQGDFFNGVGLSVSLLSDLFLKMGIDLLDLHPENRDAPP